MNEDIPKYLDLNMDQNPEGDIALFLLGVVATCDNRELADISTKVRAFRKVHKGPLILSWQDSSKYTGAFRSFSTQQIVDAFGASPYALLTPKDDTEVTGVFF